MMDTTNETCSSMALGTELRMMSDELRKSELDIMIKSIKRQCEYTIRKDYNATSAIVFLSTLLTHEESLLILKEHKVVVRFFEKLEADRAVTMYGYHVYWSKTDVEKAHEIAFKEELTDVSDVQYAVSPKLQNTRKEKMIDDDANATNTTNDVKTIWDELASCRFLSLKFIGDNLDRPWNWDILSKNPAISAWFIDNHLECPWNWKCLSKNKHLLMSFVDNHKDAAWDWDELSENWKVAPNFIQNNPQLPWNWDCLSKNKGITGSFILANRHKPWNWKHLSKNSAITRRFVADNIDLPWDWISMLDNKNDSFTFEFVSKHLNLSQNV